MADRSTPDPRWGTCLLCGDAYPPDAADCPTCGKATPGHAGGERPPTVWQRRRFRLVQSGRVLLVVGVAVGLAYVLVSAVWTGPPNIVDPLTTQGGYHLAPGGFAYLAGSITGEDYILGNYSVLAPSGTNVTFEVFNNTEFERYVHHESATPALSMTPASSGRIIFAAPYTDTFALVWENPNPAASGLVVSLYAVTNYETNVVIA